MRLPFAKEALQLALPLAILGLILWRWSIPLATGCFVFLILVLLFFRDPKRIPPQDITQVVAPADGRVLQIKKMDLDEQSWNLISIFMSPLNVHINYAPIEGEVQKIRYLPGSFLKADHQNASLQNESNALTIQGQKIQLIMKQVAGIFARRIVCYSKIGDKVKAGQKIGLIQFGSRVDLYLPESIEVKVNVGDRVKGAQTILGVIPPPSAGPMGHAL